MALILGLTLALNLITLVAVTPALATSNEVNQLIKGNLKPIQDVYAPNQNVTPDTLPVMIAKIIRVVLGFLAIIFLILILYAGFMWMTSAGNEEKVTTAKKTMVAAIIGAAIVLAAYAITYFVMDKLLLATKGTGLQ